jgi:mono/diheme cytochrome c family protein
MRHLALSIVTSTLYTFALVACSGASDRTSDSADDPASTTAPSTLQSTDDANGESTAIAVTAEVLARGVRAWGQGNCTMCHGPQGGGNQMGPDLTDDQWDHCDGSIAGIREVLVAGVSRDQLADPSHMMPMESATKLVPDEADLDALAAYVWSLSNDEAK